MTRITSDDASGDLDRLLDEATDSHEPVLITGKHSSGVLLSEADWRSVQETLHLLSVPGMRQSIHDGLATSIDECSEDPGW